MNQATLERHEMPKQPKKPASDRITVKLDRELMRKANVVAEFKGLDKQDYLEELLRPLIEADYKEFIQSEAKDLKE